MTAPDRAVLEELREREVAPSLQAAIETTQRRIAAAFPGTPKFKVRLASLTRPEGGS